MRHDEREIDDEIRGHIALAIKERVDRGEDPEAARRAAYAELGYLPAVRESVRQVWYSWWVEAAHALLRDLTLAVRTLGRHPLFSLTVVGVLTIGIGLNAAVFTMLKGLSLSPLAGVERSASLGVIYRETETGRQLRVSYPDYLRLRDHLPAFRHVFGSNVATVNLGRGRGSRPAWVELVTGNYFRALGIQARLGRTLQPSDEVAPGAPPIVVLSDSLWRRDYGADPDIVGQTVVVNNYPLTVVGVAADTFHGTIVSYDVEAFIPVMMAPQLLMEATPTMLSDARAEVLFPHGVLQPGASLEAAAVQVEAAWAALAAERPLGAAAEQLRVAPFWRSPTGAQTFLLPSLVVLSAMGLLVLLIACANIAGLVLVRGVSRRGEIALRLALGAARGRIVRLLVVENLLLAIPGAILGVVIAASGIPLLLGYAEGLAAPQHLFFNIQVDSLVIGFAAVTGTASALVFGLVPALQSTRVDLVSVINEDASPRGAARGRLRTGLVVAQVAVSLLLLVGAGLALRTVNAARRAYPGFDANHVASLELDVRQNGYDVAGGRVFYRKLLDAIRAEPGIESVTLASHRPLALLDSRAQKVTLDGYEPRHDEDLAFMSNAVGPDYFRTLRIPVLAGRAFDDGDDVGAEPVAVVNRTLAERFWGGSDQALGKRLRMTDDEWRRVVGVAADVKYSRIDEGSRPYVYLPFFQAYRANMMLHARGPAPIDVVVAQARAGVTRLDPELPIVHAGPFAESLRGAFLFYNFTAAMLLVFGAAGMMLAGLGTYGLVSYAVRQSTHEIGIRMALGASRFSVVGRFLARGLWLGLAGAALGVAAAVGTTRLLGHVLFGVSATDPLTFTGALAVVLGGVVLATLVPAWRASRTDPLHALRHQ